MWKTVTTNTLPLLRARFADPSRTLSVSMLSAADNLIWNSPSGRLVIFIEGYPVLRVDGWSWQLRIERKAGWSQAARWRQRRSTGCSRRKISDGNLRYESCWRSSGGKGKRLIDLAKVKKDCQTDKRVVVYLILVAILGDYFFFDLHEEIECSSQLSYCKRLCTGWHK